jgi:hypothetical protein
MSEYMQFRGYRFIEQNSEILNQYDWEFRFTRKPAAVYDPGDEVRYSRLKSVSGLPQLNHEPGVQEMPGGFISLQSGEVNHNDVTLELTFVDYADSSIFYLFNDWYNKIQDPETKLGMPKEYVTCDAELYQLNSQRLPVYKWVLDTGYLTSFSGGIQNNADKREVQEPFNVGLRFQFWKVEFLNAALAGI